MWKKSDAIKAFRDKMVSNNILTDKEFKEIEITVNDMIFKIFRLVGDLFPTEICCPHPPRYSQWTHL